METKFTKGEWIANIDYVPDNVIDVICDGVVIAHVYKPHDRFQLKANAKLIAAAPDMFNALEELLAQVKQFTAGNIGEQDYFRDEISNTKYFDIQNNYIIFV